MSNNSTTVMINDDNGKRRGKQTNMNTYRACLVSSLTWVFTFSFRFFEMVSISKIGGKKTKENRKLLLTF